MKKLMLHIYFAFALYPAFAQKINIDSLTQVVISRNSTAKILFSPNRDSLLKLFPSTKSTAARIKLIYDIIYNYGQLSLQQTNYYENKILELSRKDNDPTCEAIMLSEKGDVAFGNGNSTEGQKMVFDALRLAEKIGDKQAMGIVYENLAFCYPDNFNLNKLYNQKALQYSQASGDDLSACWELLSLGDNYKTFHKTDSSNYCFLRSFELSVRKNIAQAIPRNLMEVGLLQTNAKLQLKYYRAALNMPYTRIDSITKCRSLYLIASVYKKQGITDSALYFAKRAYKASGNLFIYKKMPAARLLSGLYTGVNADSALKYTNIFYTLRDSMYSFDKMARAQSLAFTDRQRQEEIEAQKITYQNNLRYYILIIIITFLMILAVVFWRNYRGKQKDNLVLQNQKEQVQNTLEELRLTQQQLIQSEKMASLGELTAGIAHEIQNPLNFVNNFSEVNIELLAEMELELKKGDAAEAIAIAADIKQNLEKIHLHGKRADGIVKGMLQHSRAGGGTKEPSDLNKLTDEFFRLAYHGLRAKDKTLTADMVTNFDNNLPLINIISPDIGRVLLNLFTNAFYALQQKQKITGDDYKPTVKVSTKLIDLPSGGKGAEIRVWDNGTGIPETLKDKIMQPFFTTKPTGEGTGLGLSLSYDIVVKAHNGKIEINSKEGEFTEFIISLPV